AELLESLNHLFIDIVRLKHEPGYGERRGGYCDLLVATLDYENPSASKLVAQKKLFLGTRSREPLRLAFRLARELKVWARLHHPNILPLLGFYLSDDCETASLISEYMVYGDLKDYITKMEPTYFERLQLVLANKIPFPNITSEAKLIWALMRDQTPCDAETLALDLPQFGDLLMKCWSVEVGERPNASDCLRTIQSSLPSFWPASITQRMVERPRGKQIQDVRDLLGPQQLPQQESPPQQTPTSPGAPSNQPDIQNLPRVSQQPQSQFREFFAIAFRYWLDQRRLTFNPPHIDGKEVERHELFFTVGALRGYRAVSEMGLWQFVGAKLGFPHSSGPLPYCKPEVADQLCKVYRESLADFEIHWHYWLRPLDPTSAFPLPPQLHHLHPNIELLAIAHYNLRPPTRSFGTWSQQPPDDAAREPNRQTLQLSQTTEATQQHQGTIWNRSGRTFPPQSVEPEGARQLGLNALQPSTPPSQASGPRQLAPIPTWKPILPTKGSVAVSFPVPAANVGSTLALADSLDAPEPLATRSDTKRNADIAAAKQLTIEESLAAWQETTPSQDAPQLGVMLEGGEYDWWWGNELGHLASENPAVSEASNPFRSLSSQSPTTNPNNELKIHPGWAAPAMVTPNILKGTDPRDDLDINYDAG
ncbi:hypothetical protein FRC01_008966, partial [Tulasnella sp. 417]